MFSFKGAPKTDVLEISKRIYYKCCFFKVSFFDQLSHLYINGLLNDVGNIDIYIDYSTLIWMWSNFWYKVQRGISPPND